MRFAWIVEPPFNFRQDGILTGCDVELARWAFAHIGESFEPVETTFEDLLPGLAEERWDVTTGMFITPERNARAPFTVPVWSLRDGLLVRRDDAGTIDGYRYIAAAGLRLAVLEGQIQHQTALRLGVRPENILILRSYADAAEAVAGGLVSAYASVELAHRDHVRHRNELACIPVPDVEKQPETGGFACRTSDIRDRLDVALSRMIGSAEHEGLLRSFGLDPVLITPPKA